MNNNTPKYEYKYLVPNECLNELRDMISPFVEADSYMKYGGLEGYTVRSIYYDTRQFEFSHIGFTLINHKDNRFKRFPADMKEETL